MLCTQQCCLYTASSVKDYSASEVVPMHPNFRMIVLANRPGFPFLGNDFFAALGELLYGLKLMTFFAPLCFCLVLPFKILGICMHSVSFTHASRMIHVWSIAEEQGMSRHEQKCAFEKFADISEVLQPLPSVKMAWRSNFTITIFSASFCCLLPLLH